ncbi:MAG: hypothetical protein ACYCT1_00605 [Steroidobacteraceae bacterium]
MDCNTTRTRSAVWVAILRLTVLNASPAFAGSALPEKVAIERVVRAFVANINRGDVRAIVGACAPHTSVIDGFPPYAWQTCRDWWKSHVSNSRSIGATLGALVIGKLLYWDVAYRRAYFI